MRKFSIDIFCKIIDNYGDIGVVYRLAKELKGFYGNEVEIRVFFDNKESAQKVIKNFDVFLEIQKIDGIEFVDEKVIGILLEKSETADVFIEAFACETPEIYIEKAKNKKSLWINLEYLSCEDWISEIHLKESLTGYEKISKFFYMPGLIEKSGGVIIDNEFLKMKTNISLEKINDILKKYFGENNIFLEKKEVISIFSYEKNFEGLLNTLINRKQEYVLIILGEKSIASFEYILREKEINLERENYKKLGNIEIIYMNNFIQEEYDIIACYSKINFVRGEESFVRGILSDKAIMWHAYFQDEEVHMEKVKAFLETLKKHFTNKKTFENYSNILYNYNQRLKNDYKLQSNEDYNWFIDNINEIEEAIRSFSKELISSCNLIVKMNEFFKQNI